MLQSVFTNGVKLYNSLPLYGKLGRVGIEIDTTEKLLSMGYDASCSTKLVPHLEWCKQKYDQLKDELNRIMRR